MLYSAKVRNRLNNNKKKIQHCELRGWAVVFRGASSKFRFSIKNGALLFFTHVRALRRHDPLSTRLFFAIPYFLSTCYAFAVLFLFLIASAFCRRCCLASDLVPSGLRESKARSAGLSSMFKRQFANPSAWKNASSQAQRIPRRTTVCDRRILAASERDTVANVPYAIRLWLELAGAGECRDFWVGRPRFL